MTPRPGLYVHVPFCAHRCGYCDFNVLVGADGSLRRRYADALGAEVARLADAGPAGVAPPGGAAGAWPAFGSVFVGGGTPTQLEADVLAGVLRAVRDRLPVAPDAEVTVEANPEDVDAAYLATLVDAGLTRLSVGAQSAAPDVLAFLDRRHEPDAPWRAVAAARDAGIGSVSVDLIYGAPAESEADWRASLDAALAAGADHVSCYSLTLEPNTPYAREVRAGAKAAPDDDVAAARMVSADGVLAAAGFRRYEVSNWARPGHESRHNRVYWTGGDYLGVGAGAHGHWRAAYPEPGPAARRWWNVRPTGRYLDRVLAGGSAVGGEELLDREAQRTERLLLGLRTAEGVERASVEPLDARALGRLVAAGLVAADADHVRLTPAGRPLADAVTRELLG